MSILTSLTKKYLVLNKKRTIITIIGIILSCALICGVATLVVSFQTFMKDIEIGENGPYHVAFYNTDKTDINYIENNASVKDTYKTNNIGYALLNESINPDKPYLYINGYNEDSFKYQNIKLISGRLPKNDNEILISSHIKDNAGVNYNIGDKINLGIGKRLLNNEELSQNNPYINTNEGKEEFKEEYKKLYTVVGIIERPNNEPYAAPGYTVITYLNDKSTNVTTNIYVISKNPGNIYKDVNNIVKELDIDKSNIDYHDALLRWYGVSNNDDANAMLYSIGGVIIAVIMIASIIVIYNSFIISITERKKQFGILSSIGATTKQLKSMVLKEGLILSLIAIPIGIISAILGIGVVILVINNLDIFSLYIDAKLRLVVSFSSILISILITSITIFLSSLIPARKASKISPIEAIRMSNDIKIKAKEVKTSKLMRNIFGIEGELGLKGIKRNKKKYRSTVISLFVSIILFMTISAFSEYSFKSSLKVYNDYNYNLIADFNLDQQISKDAMNSIENFLYNNKDVKDYSVSKPLSYTLKLDKNQINSKVIDNAYYSEDDKKYYININLYTLGSKKFKSYVKDNNIKDIKDSDLILLGNTSYYDFNIGKFYDIVLTNLKENDKIKLYNTDIENNKDIIKELNISHISNIYPTGFDKGNLQSESLIGFISEELFDTFGTNSLPTIFIDAKNPVNLQKEIDSVMKSNQLLSNIYNIDEQTKQLRNVITAINIFLYGFITLITLITVTNVINTITTSIYLRKHEFAMIKAVGMTNKDFNKMIRYESIFYGIKSIIFGIPVGIALDYLLFKSTSNMFVYDYVLPYQTIIISIVFVFLIIFITMIYSINKIKNDNIIDTIKQENL